MTNQNFHPSLVNGFHPQIPWQENNRQKVLISLHIAKCAGTSFNACLRQNFSAHMKIDTFHEWLDLHQAIENQTFQNSNNIALYGHGTWGLHELLTERDCYYITFLRDPIDRVLSRYRHESKREFKDVSMYEFLEPRIKAGGAIRRLGLDDLELAQYRLVHCLDAFGIVEQYNRSLHWFQQLYGFETVDTSQLNRTKGNEDENEQRKEVREMFEELNPGELKLYAFAVEEFNKRCPVPDASLQSEDDTTDKVSADATDKSYQDANVHVKPANTREKVQYFDPFQSIKKQVDNHIANGDYDEAIKILEDSYHKRSSDFKDFAPYRLAELYQKKHDLKNAARWAAVKRQEFVHDFLWFYALKTASQPNNDQLKIHMLVNKIAEFEHIPSDCLDSSLNIALSTLCNKLVQTVDKMTSDRSEAPQEHIRRKVEEIFSQKRNTTFPAFWDRMQRLADESISQLQSTK